MIGDTYRFQVGDFDCLVICDSDSERSISSLFPSVPKADMEAELHAIGDRDMARSCMNLLVVRASSDIILVDTGLPNTQTLPQNLKANGIDPADVTRVIITHGHGDHLGGVSYEDGVLTYPNAQYSISKADWDHFWGLANKAEHPDLTARRSLSAIKSKRHVDLIEHEGEILPGVCLVPTPGHTPGHLSPLFESRGQNLLHMVDAIRHPVQLNHPDWAPYFDYQPEVSSATRRRMIQRIADENLLMTAYHFPFPGLGHIIRQGNSYSWQSISI